MRVSSMRCRVVPVHVFSCNARQLYQLPSFEASPLRMISNIDFPNSECLKYLRYTITAIWERHISVAQFSLTELIHIIAC